MKEHKRSNKKLQPVLMSRNGRFKFSGDQMEELYSVLKKYDDDAVANFVFELELLCERAMILLELAKEGKMKKGQNKRDKMIRRFNMAIEELEWLSSKFGMLDYTEGSLLYVFPEYLEYDQKDETYHLINQALTNLEEILYLIKNKPKGGRRLADPFYFSTSIALLFSKYLGTPTTYRHGDFDEDMPFCSIVKIGLDAIGIKIEDTENMKNHLEKAVKNFKTIQNT